MNGVISKVLAFNCAGVTYFKILSEILTLLPKSPDEEAYNA